MRKYDEFTKISIHQHFGSENFSFDREIDDEVNKELKFNWKNALNIIKDAKEYKFDLITMTNSNIFDTSKYYLLRKIANKHQVELLPGIEINLKVNQKTSHLVLIFDPTSNLFEVETLINEFIKTNTKNIVTLDQLGKLLSSKRVIIIPHGIKQGSRSVSQNTDLIEYLYDIRDSVAMLVEYNNSYHKETFKQKIKLLLGKDQFDWAGNISGISGADRKKLSEISSPSYIWGEATFSDLYYSTMMSENDSNNTRIRRKEDIVNKNNYISTITIKNSDKTFIENTEIKCSHGLNTIIGPSGSGKTLLLNLINKKIKKTDLDNRSIKSNYDDISNVQDITFQNMNGEEIDYNTMAVFEGVNLYKEVLDFHKLGKDILLDKFGLKINDSDYKKEIYIFQTELNQVIKTEKNKIGQLTKINEHLTNIASLNNFLINNESDNKYELTYEEAYDFERELKKGKDKIKEINTDVLELNNTFDKLINISKKYMDEKFIESFESQRNKLKEVLNEKLLKEEVSLKKIQIKEYKHNKIMELTKNYNGIIGTAIAQKNLKKQELITANNSLYSSVKEVYKINKLRKIPVLNEALLKNAITTDGIKSDEAKINIKEIRLTFEKHELKEIFSNHISDNKTQTKLGLRSFTEPEYNLSNTESVQKLLYPFIKELKSESLTIFLDYTKVIEYDLELKIGDTKFQPIETITAGMLSKIYINKIFDDSLKTKGPNAIILYDQPDVNMEKDFILRELVDKFQKLKSDYQIFITTHEPLLVINADSNNIIKATNDRKLDEKLKIKYENISLTGTDSVNDAFEKLAILIDGSTKAVKFRSKIYGGMINEHKN